MVSHLSVSPFHSSASLFLSASSPLVCKNSVASPTPPSCKHLTVIITISHPSPLPRYRKDYISQLSVADKAMWLALAKGLKIEGSSDTPGWKHLRGSVWFFMFLESGIYWSGNAVEVATTSRVAFPGRLPRLRALQEQEINSCKAPEILVLLITRCSTTWSANQPTPAPRAIGHKQTHTQFS